MSLATHTAAALLAAAMAATGAWRVQGWRHAAAERDRLAAQQEAARINRRAADVAAATYEQQRAAQAARTVTITREIERVVQNPAYAGECLDADGLRLLRAAAAGGAAPSEPAPAVP